MRSKRRKFEGNAEALAKSPAAPAAPPLTTSGAEGLQAGAEGPGAGANRRKPGPPPPAPAPRRSPALTIEHVIVERKREEAGAAADRLRRMLAVWIVRSMRQGEKVSAPSAPGAAADGPSERPSASEGPARQAAPGETASGEGIAPDRGGK